MAITIISPSTANISDTQASLSVTVGGTIREILDILLRVNGVTVAALYDIPTATGTFTFSSTVVQAIYNAAKGYPLSACVSITAYTRNADGTNAVSISLAGGNLTINYRIKNLSLTEPASANKWDMDQVVGNLLTSSWTRTNSAFLARLKGWVWNGSAWILVFNRYGYATSSSTDVIALGYKDAIVAAMNSVSPRDFKLQIITQFDDGTADYLDLSYTESEVVGNYTKRTASYGVSKIFVTLSTIAIGNFELLPIAMSVPFNLTTFGSYPHTIRLYLKKPDGTSVLIKTQSVSAGITSGSFAIDSTERGIILNALPGVTYATTYAEVDTDTYGTTDSKSVATTLSLNADFKPTIGTVSWIEYLNYVKKALGYGVGTPFFLMSKSKLQFTVPVTNSIGATTTSIRVQFAGTDKTQANSPVITDLLNGSGSLMATITVVDSRGRSANYTSSTITVRPYTYPKVDKLEVYRSNSGGVYDPTAGTYLRCIIKGTATTVKALDGATEKNWIKYKIDYRVKNTGSYTNNAAVVPGGLTFGELTTAALVGFVDANVYDVRIRVYDAFYDLDDDNSTLEDTDDYAEGNTLLPSCDVSLILGKRYASVGKKYSGVGTLDVAEDTSGISINADGKIQTTKQIKSSIPTGTSPLDVTSTTKVPNLNADMLDDYHLGHATSNIPISDGTVNTNLNADLFDGKHLVSAQNGVGGIYDYGLGGGGNGSHILCHNNARAQTIASATNTIVQVDTIVSNTNTSVFELSGYGIKCKVAGLYMVDVMVAFTTTGTTGRVGVSIFKNAVQYDFSFIPMRDNYDKAIGCTTLRLEANDIIYFGAYQNSGANRVLAIGGYVSENRMSIAKIA